VWPVSGSERAFIKPVKRGNAFESFNWPPCFQGIVFSPGFLAEGKSKL